ncbi:MAG TPA: potassium-transporting ATPase subunit KdpB, partial [Ktedonobacteraceae bacterium]|nr:potassium-transporting ATPase subunit KdpB [Ktedonobacteraceae bacterium]
MSTDISTQQQEQLPEQPRTEIRSRRKGDISIFDPKIIRRAIIDSFIKLDPRVQLRNPVMFVVEVGSAVTTIEFVRFLLTAPSKELPREALTSETIFVLAVAVWLWFTVLFANFAEAMAEGRGKAQADTLRKARTTTIAKRLKGTRRDEVFEEVAAPDLRKGDLVLVEAGDAIPGDGEVVDGVASVDESAITGESAPVIRESGGDRSAVTGGTRVLSDWIVVKITANPGETFLDRMIALVEGAKRQKTPNEIALNILIASLTIIFVLVVVSLEPFAIYSGQAVSITTLVALLVCLIPTTIGGLLSAIGIAGMDRMVQRNVLAMSGRAVEAAGDVDVLLLDKTGTITIGNRQASRFVPIQGVDEKELAHAALLSSLSDETPEGRSIVTLARERYGLSDEAPAGTNFIPFSAQTRMSGVDLDGHLAGKDAGLHSIRKGAADSVIAYVSEQGGGSGSDELRE